MSKAKDGVAFKQTTGAYFKDASKMHALRVLYIRSLRHLDIQVFELLIDNFIFLSQILMLIFAM